MATIRPALAKVGPAWTGNPETWPGVEGKAGITNHLAQNVNPILPDPESSTLIHGGKRKSKSKSRRKSKRTLRKSKSKKTMRKSKSKSKRTLRKSKSRKTKRGGSHHGNTIVPQPIVNLGREMSYHGKNFWNAFVGNPAAVNPDPMVQPIGRN
jgi:hypothetical protein